MQRDKLNLLHDIKFMVKPIACMNAVNFSDKINVGFILRADFSIIRSAYIKAYGVSFPEA